MSKSISSGLTVREKRLLNKLDPARVPVHVSFIMDGNGRWARRRGLPRWEGHRAGINALTDVLRVAVGIDGLKYLSFFAFSTENWNRPREEIDHLFDYISEYINRKTEEFVRAGIKITTIGDLTPFPDSLKKSMKNAIERTSSGDKLRVIIALNYGGRWDILNAAKSLMKKCLQGELDPDSVNYDVFSRNLSTGDIPDPDLLVRTSGEMRISNFMLWQVAYTELYFPEKYWPDFRGKDLIEAIAEFQRRERRFGGIK